MCIVTRRGETGREVVKLGELSQERRRMTRSHTKAAIEITRAAECGLVEAAVFLAVSRGVERLGLLAAKKAGRRVVGAEGGKARVLGERGCCRRRRSRVPGGDKGRVEPAGQEERQRCGGRGGGSLGAL
jgi:hypothetical protein